MTAARPRQHPYTQDDKGAPLQCTHSPSDDPPRRHGRALAAALAALALVVGQPGLGRASVSAVNMDDINVFALSPDRSYMAEWSRATSQWTDLGSPEATDLVTGDAGVFDYYMNTGDIYECDGAPGQWTVVGGPGTWFAEGGSHLYGTSPTGDSVAQWNGPGKGWTEIGGASGEIWAGKAGLVRVNPTSNYAYIYDGTPGQWTYIGTGYAQFAVTDSAIYRVQWPVALGVLRRDLERAARELVHHRRHGQVPLRWGLTDDSTEVQ